MAKLGLINRLVGLVSPAILLRRGLALREAGQAEHAFPLLARAAEAGLAEAQYQVGRCYLEQAGVPFSRMEAESWLRRAAEAEHHPAQALLATVCLGGHSLQGRTVDDAVARPASRLFASAEAGAPDFEQALAWARRAAAGGAAADGYSVLGFIYANGPDTLRDLDASDRAYRQSAEAGSPQGALGFALSLVRGDVSPAAAIEAVKWLGVASEANLPTAQYLLGVMRQRGIGLERDLVGAVDLFAAAAGRGMRPAQARLGLALLQGVGVPQNPTDGESWLRRAGLAGDSEAAAMVGDLYAQPSDGLAPNYAEAAMWYRRAADEGHRVAARALGLMYLTGAGVVRDPEEAAVWFRKAADAGERSAHVDLANLVLAGAAAPEDSVRTHDWFKAEAEAGDLLAAFNYGVCLAEGVGAEKNEAEALVWLRRAAETVIAAQYWYGRLLLEGRGAMADPIEGRVWIERAAAADLADAQLVLAELALNGLGGDKNHDAALHWFERCAKHGNVAAMFSVGAMLGGGHEVPVDREAALHWYRRAAERGHARAQMMLGRFLARGLGGQADLASARVWLARALAGGEEAAERDLAALPADLAAE